MQPRVGYARNGEIAIGFATVGEGPNDLVYLAPFNHLDLIWESPVYSRFIKCLSSFARVIVVDRRGTGVSDDGPARAVRCARAISDAMARTGVQVRAGVHTGEIDPGGEDISGLAINVGARVAALANGGEVLVSSTVKDLVLGSALGFDDRGMHTLKGIPEPWHLYALPD